MNRLHKPSRLRPLLEQYGVNDAYPVQSRVTLGGDTMLTFKVPLGDQVIDMFVDLADVKEHQFINAIVKQVFERGVDMGKHIKAEEIISALGIEQNVEGPLTLPRIADQLRNTRTGDEACFQSDIQVVSGADAAVAPIDLEYLQVDSASAIHSAIAFLKKRAPAIQGQGGDQHTVITAQMVRDLNISEYMCCHLMRNHWNDRCDPPWSGFSLRNRVRNAYEYATRRPNHEDVSAADTDELLMKSVGLTSND